MDECPICLLPLIGTLTITGCCKKQFHTECHVKCMQQKSECPLCRSKEFIINIENETLETNVQTSIRMLCYIMSIATVMYAIRVFMVK